MITRTLKSLFRRNPASAATHTRLRQLDRPPFRLELLEDRCEICGVLPTALDDEYWATADELLTVLPSGVLANDSLGVQGGDGDTDPCGTTLSAVLVQGPDEGSLSLNSDGSFTFTKESVGAVTFTYMACDDLGYCSTVATVTINVQKAPAKIIFRQDRGIFNPAPPPSGLWGQPFTQADGAFYGSGSIIAGAGGAGSINDTTPAWATSYVTIWGPGAVCNSVSPGNKDAGTLTAVLRGSPGASYTVDLQIDVNVSTTSAVNQPYAKADIIDLTTGTTLGSVRTQLGQPSDNFSMSLTLSVFVPIIIPPPVLGNGEVELVRIHPTMCGSGAAGTAYFTGTIYVSSAV